MPSRRQHTRIAVRCPASIALANGGGRSGTTLDVSIEGLSLSTELPIAPGSRCTVRLELPCRSGARPLQVDAKSIYSSYSGPGDFRIGMVFVNLDAESESVIRDFAA